MFDWKRKVAEKKLRDEVAKHKNNDYSLISSFSSTMDQVTLGQSDATAHSTCSHIGHTDDSNNSSSCDS